MTTADTSNPPTAVQPARARGLKRAPRSTKRVTLKDLQKLRPGESLTDPAADGLRWRCMSGKGSDRAAIYAEVRYKDPVTGKRLPKSLGRLPTDHDEATDYIERELLDRQRIRSLGQMEASHP